MPSPSHPPPLPPPPSSPSWGCATQVSKSQVSAEPIGRAALAPPRPLGLAGGGLGQDAKILGSSRVWSGEGERAGAAGRGDPGPLGRVSWAGLAVSGPWGGDGARRGAAGCSRGGLAEPRPRRAGGLPH